MAGHMSKTRLFRSLKALDLEAVETLLEAEPALRRVTDERRRNALHFLCGLTASERTRARSLKLAEYLLRAGFDVNEPAFVEGGGAFKATPLWYCLSRGRNLALARLLLKHGSTPEYSLWTAAFHDDVEAIDLLVASGATLDPVTEDETPFLGAIKWSRFRAAERLLHHGANVNFRDSKGMTALHLVLKKNSDRKHVEMLVRYAADPRIKDRQGRTALDMVARRRDKSYLELLTSRDAGRATRKG